MTSLELHFYDGKIEKREEEDLGLLKNEYDIQKLENGLGKLREYIPINKPNILHNLCVILNDYKTFGRNPGCPNYDPSNCFFACELLSICFDILFEKKYSEEDFQGLMKVFLEQIDDMSTGMCPPGRTTRLVQFILTTQR